MLAAADLVECALYNTELMPAPCRVHQIHLLRVAPAAGMYGSLINLESLEIRNSELCLCTFRVRKMYVIRHAQTHNLLSLILGKYIRGVSLSPTVCLRCVSIMNAIAESVMVTLRKLKHLSVCTC